MPKMRKKYGTLDDFVYEMAYILVHIRRGGAPGKQSKEKIRASIARSSAKVDMSVIANAREMRYDCPYCKKEKGCCSLFFWAVRLTAEDYQALVELGWCRCGRMVYFPINQKCCCPQHSMRIDALRFRPNKRQKRVRKRIESLQAGKWIPNLEGGHDNNEDQNEGDTKAEKKEGREQINGFSTTTTMGNHRHQRVPTTLISTGDDTILLEVLKDMKVVQEVVLEELLASEKGNHGNDDAAAGEEDHNHSLVIPSQSPSTIRPKKQQQQQHLILHHHLSPSFPGFVQVVKTIAVAAAGGGGGQGEGRRRKGIESIKRQKKSRRKDNRNSERRGRGQLTSSVAFVTAAKLRRRRKHQTTTTNGNANAAALLPPGVKIEVGGKAHLNAYVPSLLLHKKKKNPEINQNNEENNFDGGKAHFSSEIFDLYANYQVTIHHDPVERITHQEFKAFLVDTPLLSTKGVQKWGEIWPHGCGSLFRKYHLRKIIKQEHQNKKQKGGEQQQILIGFAVLDIMPECFYSSYFVWHPGKARKLSLGVLSALEEIEIVKSLAQATENPRHLYYIGYYVHGNKQMRYKTQYKPAELYCPFLKAWVPFDEATKMTHNNEISFDNGRYSNDADDEESRGNEEKKEDLERGDRVLAVPTLGDDGDNDESDDDTCTIIDSVRLLWNHSIVSFKDVKEQIVASHPSLRSQLKGYAQMVGPDLASRMTYVVTGCTVMQPPLGVKMCHGCSHVTWHLCTSAPSTTACRVRVQDQGSGSGLGFGVRVQDQGSGSGFRIR
eukprot:jgi/Bigna1/72440/fgenesh1_pg.19_\